MKRALLLIFATLLPACAADSADSTPTGEPPVATADAAPAATPEAADADGGAQAHFLKTGRPVKVDGLPDYDVDITGKNLLVALNYEDKGALLPTDHFLNAATPASLSTHIPFLMTDVVTGAGGIPGLGAVPLSTMFDTFWSGTPDPVTHLTLHDVAVSVTKQAIIDAVSQMGQSASNVVVTIPTTGKLGVLAGPPVADFTTGQVKGSLSFDYDISRVHATFNAPGIAAWALDFDIRVTVVMSYTPGPCTFFNVSADAMIEFVNISPNNFAATVIEGFGDLVNFLEGKPANIFQNAIGAIGSTSVGVDVGPVTQLLGLLGATCQAEEVPLGFKQFVVSTDFLAKTLTFRLTHPLDPAPTFIAPPGLTVDSPTLQVPQFSEVFAGQQVTVNGTFFPRNQSTDATIAWNDTTSGNITDSIVQFEPLFTAPTIKDLPRQPFDGKNTFTVTTLQPSTTFLFSVQDCDVLTCTPPSLPLPIVTAATTPPVTLLLQGPSGSVNVGTVTADAFGNFTTSITVPPGTTPGIYTIAAQLGGSTVATTTITVIAPGQPLPPILEFFDPATNTLSPGNFVCGSKPCERVANSGTVTVRGEGFAPGGTVVFTADTLNGTTLGAVTADASGGFTASFPWIAGTGDHLLIASELVHGAFVQASVTVEDFQLQ